MKQAGQTGAGGQGALHEVRLKAWTDMIVLPPSVHEQVYKDWKRSWQGRDGDRQRVSIRLGRLRRDTASD